MSELLWDGTRGLSGGKRSSLSSRDFRRDLVSGATPPSRMLERRKSHGPSLRKFRDRREGRNCHALGRHLLACSRRPLEVN
jgi:hypothetical protein